MTDEANQAANQMIVDPGHTHGMTWGEMAGALSPLRVRPPTHNGQPIAPGHLLNPSTAMHEAMKMRASQEASAELRPPAEYDGTLWHWLQVGSERRVCMWVSAAGSGAWFMAGDPRCFDPDQLPRMGYRYLGPAEWKGGSWDREKAVRLATDELLQAAANRIAALESENVRLSSNVRAGVNPDPSQTWTGHMIWWPDELPTPFFDGEIGKRTVAAWSVKLTPSERLSASWHHLPCITTGATVPPHAGGFPAQALRGGDGVPR